MCRTSEPSRFFVLAFAFVLAAGACAGSTGDPAVGGPGTGGKGTGGATASGSGGAQQPAATGGAPGVATGGNGGPAIGTGGAGETSGSGGAAAPGGAVGRAGGNGTAGRGGPGGGGATGTAPDGGVDAVRVMDSGAATDVNQATLPNVTLHLAGDSTVMTYLQPTATADEGWGQELGQFFISKVAINNQAIGGASVASFHTSRWNNIISALKAGDYVMAAFGANDSGSVQGRHVEPAAFQALFAQMADEVKAKQATFIPVTPSALQEWAGGREGNARLGPYVAATKAVGPLKEVLVDDLNARSVEFLNTIGQTAAMQIYKAGDKAHFTKMGATQMATFVAEELRRIGSPLGAYLK